jgi:hypothetical protein
MFGRYRITPRDFQVTPGLLMLDVTRGNIVYDAMHTIAAVRALGKTSY